MDKSTVDDNWYLHYNDAFTDLNPSYRHDPNFAKPLYVANQACWLLSEIGKHVRSKATVDDMVKPRWNHVHRCWEYYCRVATKGHYEWVIETLLKAELQLGK